MTTSRPSNSTLSAPELPTPTPPLSSSLPPPVPGLSSADSAPAVASSSVAPAPLSKTKRDRQAHNEVFNRGNYHGYYGFRTDCVPDARLQLLEPALFEGRNVLDLGCNAGKLSIETLVHLGARRVVGLDIDPVLIAQSEAARVAAGLADDARLSFVEADFLPPGFFDSAPARALLPPGERFETILLLSITKWLHLHAGDDGLLVLFHALAGLLPPGGALVVEPQEWANYKSAARKAKDLRPVFAAIKMRPDFEPYLGQEGGECGEGAGLVLERKIERDEGGFSRPLCVWRKE